MIVIGIIFTALLVALLLKISNLIEFLNGDNNDNTF